MIKSIANIWFNFWKSFEIKAGGFSFRKVLSFIVMLLIIWLHFSYVTDENFINVLEYDFLAIMAFLGLINLDKYFLYKFNASKGSDSSVVPEEPTEPFIPEPEEPTDNDINVSDDAKVVVNVNFKKNNGDEAP
jgi:hypothetical protein